MTKSNDNQIKIGSAAARKRQQLLADILAPSTSDFLGQVSLAEKKHVLDLGCATGESTFLLKDVIHPLGQITGLDSNKAQLRIAREKVQEAGLTHVAFRYHNPMEWHEAGQYDLVYSRQFFDQLKDPAVMLQQLFNSLRPGGLAMVEVLDYGQFQCFPQSYAFDRYIELYQQLLSKQGIDPCIGKHLLSLFQEKGFQHSQMQRVRPTFLKTKQKQIASLGLESISPLLESEQLVSPAELQALLAELKAYEVQENTMISQPGIYQVLGYKANTLNR